jgi:deoxyribodipyrimidine photo-lyase
VAAQVSATRAAQTRARSSRRNRLAAARLLLARATGFASRPLPQRLHCFAATSAPIPPRRPPLGPQPLQMADSKRKADGEDAAGGSAPAKAARGAAGGPLVHPRRVRVLSKGPAAAPASGPVLYWMSRDQRAADNWALLHALEAAGKSGAPVAVVFNLLPEFLSAGARHFGFMLRGLRETAAALQRQGVPFFLVRGDPAAEVPALAKRLGASLLVTDFSPLRVGRQWRDAVAAASPCAVHEVDAHNVVPCWEASPKLEYAARTIRPKITAKLAEYLTDFPATPRPAPWTAAQPEAIDWDSLIAQALAVGSEVPEVAWAVPGEAAAARMLEGDGPESFLPKRLKLYEKRNDPNVPGALSGLSPWLHFGQLAPQRAALAAKAHSKAHSKAVDGFVEELVVRRELADNFCFYNANYDNLAGASDWARDSLRLHASDKREFLYTRAQLEAGATQDRLWNAAQMELVHLGKMHGFMRMYWAKKILEWTASPEVALADAIYLNDRYSLDGRDPNGYVGCMWSIAGIHDMGWAERPVFGKIRFMNYAGCKRKFNIESYITRIGQEVHAIKTAAKKKAGAA